MKKPRMSETEFLQQEAAAAKDALKQTLSDAGRAAKATLDIETWVDRHPWGCIGTAFSIGLLGGLRPGYHKTTPGAAPVQNVSAAQGAGAAGIAAAAASGLFTTALKYAASQIAEGLKAGAASSENEYSDENNFAAESDEPAPDYEFLGRDGVA